MHSGLSACTAGSAGQGWLLEASSRPRREVAQQGRRSSSSKLPWLSLSPLLASPDLQGPRLPRCAPPLLVFNSSLVCWGIPFPACSHGFPDQSLCGPSPPHLWFHALMSLIPQLLRSTFVSFWHPRLPAATWRTSLASPSPSWAPTSATSSGRRRGRGRGGCRAGQGAAPLRPSPCRRRAGVAPASTRAALPFTHRHRTSGLQHPSILPAPSAPPPHLLWFPSARPPSPERLLRRKGLHRDGGEAGPAERPALHA